VAAAAKALEEEHEAALPDDVKERVAKAVERELVSGEIGGGGCGGEGRECLVVQLLQRVMCLLTLRCGSCGDGTVLLTVSPSSLPARRRTYMRKWKTFSPAAMLDCWPSWRCLRIMLLEPQRGRGAAALLLLLKPEAV